MKKVLLLVLTVILAFSVFAFTACDKNNQTAEILRFAVPDGTPALSIAKLINDGCKVDGEDVDVEIVAANLIGSEVAGEKADIAIMPTNAAANIINQGGDYKIVASNIFGVLYLIAKDGSAETFALNDLVGKVIASIGQQNTPQYVLEAILNDADVPYETGTQPVEGKVVVNYLADGAAVLGALNADTADFGLVGEPAATAAGIKFGFVSVFDLQQGYANTMGEDTIGYPQASLVVKTSVLNSRPELIEKLLDELEDGVDWISNADNKAGLTALLATKGSVTTFPPASIDRCNVRLERASDVKADVKKFMTDCFGITLSDDAFYIPVD